MQMIDLTFVFRSLKRRCHGNQSCDQIGEIGLRDYVIFICRIPAFQNGFEYRNAHADERVHSSDEPSTSDRNLANYVRQVAALLGRDCCALGFATHS